MSPELKEALRLWLIDATSNNPSDCVRRYGLCHFVSNWGDGTCGRELIALLVTEFLDPSWPFNEGDPTSYWGDTERFTHHLNPKRLGWVRKKLGVTA